MLQKHLEKHYERKFDKFNEAVRALRDHMLLRRDECEEVIEAINAKLLSEQGNKVAKHLRNALCLAIDVMAYEDALNAK